MADRLLFALSDGWALGANNNQWMQLRGRKRHAETVWQPVAYIASTKTDLLLSMAEKDIQLTEDAQARLNGLPERFLDWRPAMRNPATARSAA
jgi:hypothetical protein